MTVALADAAPADLAVDLLLIPLPLDPDDALVDALADTLGPAVGVAARDFTAETGATQVCYPEHAAATRAALVGLGAPGALTPGGKGAEALRQAAAGGAQVALDRQAATVACLVPATDVPDAEAAQALTEGVLLGAYRYRRYKTDADGFDGPAELHLAVGDAHDAEALADGARRGRLLAMATRSARDLVNRSPDEKLAPEFAGLIEASGAAHGYGVETWDEARIREEGLGGLLGVNRGSVTPPTFSVLTWAPDDAVNDRPVVLVGKGVVFDTGGLSLKSTKGSMDLMKSDMAGAAAVVGAFEALAGLGVPLHVIGLVPATDNRPGEAAYVPGDVLRMHSGATVEVLNTDAEGRLILADALSYAQGLDPALVIDLATLTGSALIALGHEAAAVMTNEDDEAPERLYALQRAGERSGDRVHPLPLFAEYKQQLDSDVADLKNVGGRPAGAITAGKFLEHFTAYPWMHLDIAGTAFLESAKPYRPKGGTGFGVRLLATFLATYAEAQR